MPSDMPRRWIRYNWTLVQAPPTHIRVGPKSSLSAAYLAITYMLVCEAPPKIPRTWGPTTTPLSRSPTAPGSRTRCARGGIPKRSATPKANFASGGRDTACARNNSNISSLHDWVVGPHFQRSLIAARLRAENEGRGGLRQTARCTSA